MARGSVGAAGGRGVERDGRGERKRRVGSFLQARLAAVQRDAVEVGEQELVGVGMRIHFFFGTMESFFEFSFIKGL